MPFDSTTFRQPTVTVLPPQPPERGGGPRRIHVRSRSSNGGPTPQRRGYRFGTVTMTLLIIAHTRRARRLHGRLGETIVLAEPSLARAS